MNHKSLPGKTLTALVLIILMTACSKDTSSPPDSSNQGDPQTGPQVLNLVTDYWQQQGFQPVYVSTFSGIIKNQQGNMRVYLETGNQEILISSTKVGLDEGEIWCQEVGIDLQIIYRDFLQHSPAPGPINIKVVFD